MSEDGGRKELDVVSCAGVIGVFWKYGNKAEFVLKRETSWERERDRNVIERVDVFCFRDRSI